MTLANSLWMSFASELAMRRSQIFRFIRQPSLSTEFIFAVSPTSSTHMAGALSFDEFVAWLEQGRVWKARNSESKQVE